SLAQIGEFSFILIGLGLELQIVPPEARDLVLAGAIVSILVNPLIFRLLEGRGRRASDATLEAKAKPLLPTLSDHDVLIGYGRVGSLIGAALAREGARMVVIETSDSGLAQARRDG